MNKYLLAILLFFVPQVFAAQSVTLSTKLAGEDLTHDVQVIEQGQFMYETVAASQTDQVCGVTGGVGDYLDEVVVQITTSGANGVVSIKDGSGSSIPLVPASTPIGVYPIPIHSSSTGGAWKITTGSAATALCVGRFTP